MPPNAEGTSLHCILPTSVRPVPNGSVLVRRLISPPVARRLSMSSSSQRGSRPWPRRWRPRAAQRSRTVTSPASWSESGALRYHGVVVVESMCCFCFFFFRVKRETALAPALRPLRRGSPHISPFQDMGFWWSVFLGCWGGWDDGMPISLEVVAILIPGIPEE